MPTAKAGEGAIGDEAVGNRTGKNWNQWFSILDKWGAMEKGHKAMAEYLHTKHAVSPWWSQTVTIRYERERGLRVVGQKGKNFEVSVQRTIGTTVKKAFEAWTEPKILNKWFTTKAKVDLKVGGKYSNSDKDKGECKVIVPGKRLRFTWENEEHCPDTVVEVTFTPQKGGKVAVRVTHFLLKNTRQRDEMKSGWSWALDSLKTHIETGKKLKYENWLKDKKRKG